MNINLYHDLLETEFSRQIDELSSLDTPQRIQALETLVIGLRSRTREQHRAGAVAAERKSKFMSTMFGVSDMEMASTLAKETFSPPKNLRSEHGELQDGGVSSDSYEPR